MNKSTHTRITLANAIVAAEKLGGSVVFDIDPLTTAMQSMEKDDVILFETKQLDTRTFSVSLLNKQNVQAM